MRGRSIFSAFLIIVFAACSNGSGLAPVPITNGGAPPPILDLSPSPLDLNDGAPVDALTASGDTPGVAYTPTADASCTTPDGAIAIAGDGQAQVDQAGVPLMFVASAIGSTPPPSCGVTVKGSDGSDATAQISYEVVPLIASLKKKPVVRLAVAPGAGVTPASATITQANQSVSLVASGFSGTTVATVGSGCSSGSGVQVSPKQVTGGAGTFTVLPFGQGAIAKSCTLTIADTATGLVSVPVTLAIPALQKFTAAPKIVQFGCAGSSAPTACQTTRSVTLAETGAQTFSIVTRASLKQSCANVFDGPLTITTGNGAYVRSIAGPSASVAFAGLLPGATLGCSTIVITDNGDPAQRVTLSVDQSFATPPPPVAPAVAPPCVGPDPHVAVPGKPHGMYVWNPYTVDGGIYEQQLEQNVIGKDPTLCGVSLVVRWSDLESTKGVYDFSEIDDPTTGLAAPYVNAGLTVNLLFSDGPERGQNNPVTPAWVTASNGDGVPIVHCDDQPPAPDYLSPTFEADWKAFIAHAVAHYSYNASAMAPHIGYMRFAIGFGVEAIPAHFDNGEHADCLGEWQQAPVNFTYDGWVQHAKNVVNALGEQTTDKQLLVALNQLDGGASFYDYPNAVAEDAANKGIGFGTENLGIANVALPTSIPGACNPQAKIVNLYWCQALTRHVGQVPFEFQTIVASTAPMPGESSIDLGKVLQYGLDNDTQIFELYPQEWLAADVAGFTTAPDRLAHQAALRDTSLVLGAHP